MPAPRSEGRPLPQTSDAYLPQLDGVRAIAVLLVLVQHWIGNPLRMGAPFGFAGVTMFFVLSGYLISRILFQAKDRTDRGAATAGRSLKIFYARRSLRIFPIYYLTVALLWLAGDPSARESIAWLLTYTINFRFLAGGERQGLNHLWTLAIEEQYYLLYPFIVLFCPPRFRLSVLGAMCAVALASRIVLDRMGVATADNKFFTLACFDSFALGGVVAHVEGTRGKEAVQAFFRKPWVGIATVGIVAVFGAAGALLGDAGSARVVWFRAVVSLASLYVIGLALLDSELLGRVLGNRALVYTGKISYGIYLYHLYVPHMVHWAFPSAARAPLPVRFGLYTAVTLLISTASWYLIERPINAQKKRFEHRA